MFESDFPEFIISESLFTWRLQCIENAALLNLEVVAYWKPTNDLTLARNSREDVEMEAYSGTLKKLLTDSDQEPDDHLLNSGYGTMELAWNGGGPDSFLSPWEVTLKDRMDDTPLPPRLKEAERRAIGNVLAKIETNPVVKEFFLHPVDERRYPDYRCRVEVPMDFSFIKERLAAGYYCSVESVLADAKLIRINCIKYNGLNELSQRASLIYDEFENEVRNSIGVSASFEPLNDPASQVDASRARRDALRQQQRPSTRRSSTEATSLEQLPLPNARHSEGRPSRRSSQRRNEVPSRVAVAPRRATRSGTASSEVLEDPGNVGDRSTSKAPVHDDDDDVDSFQSERDEDIYTSEEPSEAYSSEGQSESDSDDDIARTGRSSIRGRQPSRYHAELKSRQPNHAAGTRKYEPPLPNARHSEGRPSRRSSQRRNEVPSRVAVAHRRTTRSVTASSEVLEDPGNVGDRSTNKAPVHDDDDGVDSFQSERDDIYTSEVPSEAYSSEGQNESDPDDDIAQTGRSSIRGRQPSRHHAELKSRQPNRAAGTRKYEDRSPPTLQRRSTRVSSSTSVREEPKPSSISMAQANSSESHLVSKRRSSTVPAVFLRREEPRTSPRRSRARANATEKAESPPQRRSSRASASTSHPQGHSGAAVIPIGETWSSPSRASRSRPTKSYADISHSEMDNDDDSFEKEDYGEVPQRRTRKRGASKPSSGKFYCCVSAVYSWVLIPHFHA